jgi:two-component system cell cycle response regulator CpdR
MGARILLVDDDAVTLDLLARLLRREGYDVDLAESADEAIERLRAGAYDILLTDLVMPGSSGLELVREAQRLHGAIRCFVTSGQRRPDGGLPEHVAWIAKPLDLPDLFGQLRRA